MSRLASRRPRMGRRGWVPEIAGFVWVWAPTRAVRCHGCGILISGCNRIEIVRFGAWITLLHLVAFIAFKVPAERGQITPAHRPLSGPKACSKVYERPIVQRTVEVPSSAAFSQGRRPTVQVVPIGFYPRDSRHCITRVDASLAGRCSRGVTDSLLGCRRDIRLIYARIHLAIFDVNLK